MTTGEAVALKNEIGVFRYTAPLFGLESLEDGPGTNSKAVVGIYVGFTRGSTQLMGFDPDSKDWEPIEVLQPNEMTTLSPVIDASETLKQWLAERYPDDSLVFYERGNPGLN